MFPPARIIGLFAWIAASTPAAFAATAAGAAIENTAHGDYKLGAAEVQADSNRHVLIVDEIVRFEVTPVTTHISSVQPQQTVVYAFDVRNAGNGAECFVLTQPPAAAGAAAMEVVSFNLDRNGDGKFDPAIDTAFSPGDCGKHLTPGETARIFVVAKSPAAMEAAGSASLMLNVRASLTGPLGSVFPGAGAGGGDAVIDWPPEAGFLTFMATASNLIVALEKSQTVAGDPSRTSAAAGEIITYALTVRVSGEGQLSGAVLTDPLPADLAYVPGTLRLDGQLLSDVEDDDAGSVSGGAVSVRLADRAAPFAATVAFQAVVRPPSP